uniref:Uncharacterized protein n=3 Tax=Oryza TaxID=4527 RepID=A0A0D3FJK0_9ORYZ
MASLVRHGWQGRVGRRHGRRGQGGGEKWQRLGDKMSDGRRGQGGGKEAEDGRERWRSGWRTRPRKCCRGITRRRWALLLPFRELRLRRRCSRLHARLRWPPALSPRRNTALAGEGDAPYPPAASLPSIVSMEAEATSCLAALVSRATCCFSPPMTKTRRRVAAKAEITAGTAPTPPSICAAAGVPSRRRRDPLAPKSVLSFPPSTIARANAALPTGTKPFSFQSLAAHILCAVSRARDLGPSDITVFLTVASPLNCPPCVAAHHLP